MATPATGVTGGFVIDASRAETAHDDDQADESVEQELARKAITRLTQGLPKAALAAAVDLVNTICASHDLQGGAWM